MGTVTDLPANIASADRYDVLVDRDGTVWVRVRVRRADWWAYLTDTGELGWDTRRVLPEDYEPYRPLDAAAARIVQRATCLKGDER